MIRAYVISDRSRPAARDLPSLLSGHFDVVLVPPVYLTAEQFADPRTVDARAFQARHRRAPLIGEVGCAAAHRSVYLEMSTRLDFWALVLEDDALVDDVGELCRRVTQLTSTLDPDTPTVVSFNARRTPLHRFMRRGPAPATYQTPIAPFGTFGYLINISAATLLQALQDPISSQADWPATPRQVDFLVDTDVEIGTEDAGSSIVDPHDARQQFTMQQRWETWSGTWYRRNREHFDSPKQYWEVVLKPRLMWHVNRAAQRIAPIGSDNG